MWFWYALLAAMLGAVSVMINKRALKMVNASVLTFGIFAFQLPFLMVLSLVNGRVTVLPTFWWGILVSALVFVVGKTLSLSSMKQSVLSKITPLTALSAAFSYILGIVFLGEILRLLPVLGLGLLIMGAYAINVAAANERWLMPFLLLWRERAPRLFILAAMAGGTAAVFDKMAVIATVPTNPAVVLLWENLIMSVVLLAFLILRKPYWYRQISDNAGVLMLASLVYMMMSLVLFWGFSKGPVALAVGVKNLQVLFVMGLSWRLFGDKPTKSLWLAALLMMVGVILVKAF